MDEYHKIQTLWLRDPANKNRTLLEGQWAKPEFEYLANCQWRFTEKVNGTNTRVVWDGERVTFFGKTNDSQLPTMWIVQLTDMFHPRLLASVFDGPACLYGESYGSKIERGGELYIPDGQDFILFDVKVGEWWLRWGDVLDVATKVHCLAVPTIGTGTLNT